VRECAFSSSAAANCFDGLAFSTLLPQQEPKLVARLKMARIELDGGLESARRLFIVARAHQGLSQAKLVDH
jgi:hypothetical protein